MTINLPIKVTEAAFVDGEPNALDVRIEFPTEARISIAVKKDIESAVNAHDALCEVARAAKEFEDHNGMGTATEQAALHRKIIAALSRLPEGTI